MWQNLFPYFQIPISQRFLTNILNLFYFLQKKLAFRKTIPANGPATPMLYEKDNYTFIATIIQ